MLAMITRVRSAVLTSENGHEAAIGDGLVMLVGIAAVDVEFDSGITSVVSSNPTDGRGREMKVSKSIDWLVKKTLNLRLFVNENSNNGRMSCSLLQTGYELLCVSQFTLFGDVMKGRSPSFSAAAPPHLARAVFDRLLKKFEAELGDKLKCGDFGAHMDIKAEMDGPVTLFLDSEKKSFSEKKIP